MREFEKFSLGYPNSDTRDITKSARRLLEEATEFQQGVEGLASECDLLLELGDCAFFIARAAQSLGFTFDDVLEANILKLTYRNAFGKNPEAERKIVRAYFENR